MNSRPDQIDTAIQSALEVLTEKVIDSAINIDTGVMTLAEGQQYALDAQAQAHAAVKMLMLKTQVQMLKELYILPNVYPEKINGEYTHVQAIYKSALADRIKNLEGEIKEMQG